MAQKKICLTMIVKNESKTIERCLNSIKEIVDYICICDTGSTDDTIDIITGFLAAHRIPGSIHKHVWKDFGYNRTRSAVVAKQDLASLGSSLENWYLLLLDADMVLNIFQEFRKNDLVLDSYLVMQNLDSLSLYNIRLIKASLDWNCIGPTHEYWSCKLPSLSEKLETMSILDFGDGGCKATKYERDLKLLIEAVKNEPENARHVFYLAQTYFDLDDYDQAIKWYKSRIALKGWDEEVWYSLYKIGLAYEAMGKWDLALQEYLKAYQYLPTRAEPLEKLAAYYCLKEKYHLAYLFASEGSKIPYPKYHVLFISVPVYNYRFDEILSIAAYYTSHRADGASALHRLLNNPRIPAAVRAQALKNACFYNINSESLEKNFEDECSVESVDCA